MASQIYPGRVDHNGSGQQHYRSWGEAQIGRMLDRHGMPYLYEHPLAVIDERGHTRIWYPDFQLRSYGMLIEYFGRANELAHQEGMERKRAIYEANGVTAMLLTRRGLEGNWPARLLDQIESLMSDRTKAIREARGRSGDPSLLTEMWGHQ